MKFKFGFRFSVHLELTFKPGIRNRMTCVDKYSEGQFGLISNCKLDFL